MCTINDNMTIIWCMVPEIWSTTDIIFCHFGPFFALSPSNNLKNQNFEEIKKAHGDIILHKCTKNHDHMLHCSWDTMHDICNFHFSFYTCVPKVMMYGSWDMVWKDEWTDGQMNRQKKWHKEVGALPNNILIMPKFIKINKLKISRCLVRLKEGQEQLGVIVWF